MDKFARTHIPGEARQVLDLILRKTYGWHKKEDAISLRQFARLTGLKKSNVVRALKTLVSMNIIYKGGIVNDTQGGIENDTPFGQVYGFNKNFDEWVREGRRRGGIENDTGGGIIKRKKGVSKTIPTKETIQKKTIQKKEVSVDPRVKLGIDHYFKTFKAHFGTPPVIQGVKDASIIKSLLKHIDLEELQYLIGQFFESTDEWIMRSGYTIGAFKSQINKLRLGERKKLSPGDLWLLTKEEQDRRAANGKERQTTFQIGNGKVGITPSEPVIDGEGKGFED